MLEVESVLCRTRMVHFLFSPPPFVNNKQYGKGKTSQAVVFVYVFASNFAPTIHPPNSVEHDQPLLHLSIPCLFPLILILRSLLYFLNFYFMLEYPKG